MSQSQDALKSQILARPVPQHVAIIMDGNGRWAKSRGKLRLFGHHQGAENVKEIVKAASAIGVKVLTLYAFSTENWTRPKEEVSGLMQLLKVILNRELNALHQNNVRLGVIGRLADLPKEVRSVLEAAIEKLKNNSGILLSLALSYGGRQEILDAVNRLLQSGKREVTEAEFSLQLTTAGLPDPDVIIRTSGEERISNFLLYQGAYAEFITVAELWPDFRTEEFYRAILTYQKRERRFGGVQAQLSSPS